MDLIYWQIFATLTAIINAYLIKQYVISLNMFYLLLIMLLYMVLMISYINIFEQKEVSSSYTVIQIMQILVVVVMGLLFFDEEITSNKVIGVCFGLWSVYLLS